MPLCAAALLCVTGLALSASSSPTAPAQAAPAPATPLEAATGPRWPRTYPAPSLEDCAPRRSPASTSSCAAPSWCTSPPTAVRLCRRPVPARGPREPERRAPPRAAPGADQRGARIADGGVFASPAQVHHHRVHRCRLPVLPRAAQQIAELQPPGRQGPLHVLSALGARHRQWSKAEAVWCSPDRNAMRSPRAKLGQSLKAEGLPAQSGGAMNTRWAGRSA